VFSDETVLRLNGVELATGTVGFETGSFDRQLEHGDVAAMVGFGFGERLGRRDQASRFQNGEELFENTVL